MFKKILNFVSPLICDDTNKISIGRFWITILLCFSCWKFWYLNQDIPAFLAQIIFFLLAYVLGSKGFRYAKDSFGSYTDVKWKSTKEVEKYKVDSSKAAKLDDGD